MTAPVPFDHSALDALLRRHVRGDRVDYAALRADAPALDAYLAALAIAEPDAWPSREKQLAFWINAYNAHTLRLVLDHYPLAGIRDICDPAHPDAPTPWRLPRGPVAGRLLSLDEIEHAILRERFGEARIHFAINCASASCPVLRPGAYAASGLSAQLDEQTRLFLGDGVRNHLRLQAGTLQLSRIFTRWRIDFEKAAGSLEQFLAPYLAPETAARLLNGGLRLEFLDYDWSLNDSPSRPPLVHDGRSPTPDPA